MGRTSSYAAEFRHEAVQLVLESDKTITQVATDLGISHKTFGNWVRDARAGQVRAGLPGAITESEREELRRLRSENHTLRIEREILRKAAAYFAKETIR